MTTLNFAQIKGTLYCKPHFLQLFSLRGKYDDIDGGSEKHSKTPPASIDKSPSIVKDSSASSASATPLSTVKSENTASTSSLNASADSVNLENNDDHAIIPEDSVKIDVAETVPVIEQVSTPIESTGENDSVPDASSIPKDIPVAVVKPLVVPPKPSVSTASVTSAKPAAQTSSGGSPKVVYGGNLGKCASCAKTVYPADSHVSTDGLVFHTQCFKCTHCKSQLTLTTLAQIKGTPYCKTHFIELFKLRGKYDDIAPMNSSE